MEQLIKHGLIHCHTENSLKDSALSPAQLVARAKEMGAPAVTLTDHGTLTGIYEFINAAKNQGIKAIPGVEAYVQEDNDLRRMHLLLLAKDYTGYKAISRAVTKSNTRLHDDYPCFNMEIIREFFAEGTIGHGHVIATSACVGGVLAQILLKNAEIDKEIRKLERRAEKYSNPSDPIYLGNKKMEEEFHEKVEELIKRRDALKKIADMKFGAREKALKKLSGEALETARAELEADKKRASDAKTELEAVKTEIGKTKRRETTAKQARKDAEKSQEKWHYVQGEIAKLSAAKVDEDALHDEAWRKAEEYRSIFGDGNFYVELQNHGIEEEAIVMPKLADIAEDLCLPIVACNDVHFSNNDPKCVRARRIVSALRFNKWNTPRPDDTEYYIKSDAELKDWLCRILPESTVNEAFHGIQTIVDACDVEFPTTTHFPTFVGGIPGETAEQRLRRLTEEGIAKRYPNQPFQYRERVEYELEIINKMHYTDYLCIVQDYLDFGRQLGVDCPEGVGYAIGPGRGSAAGSLVCYLIGITSVDPMPLGLLFERFLNPDRISSPDIDADLSMEVRSKVYDYVRKKYGEEAVCSIMTKGRMAAKEAIRSVARIRGSELYDDTRRFLDLGAALNKVIGNDPGAQLKDYENDLRAAFPDDKDAQEIISDAMLVEGVAINYGMHAAGVIIADNGDVGEYTPLMWNDEKGQWCTQCDKVEAEEMAGLLKFDFLGLRNLDIITMALRLIKRNTGVSIDIEKVPQESEIYREIFAKGRTNFIFQFESDGMKNLLRKFKPENLEHLITLNALFRPGPLQYADAICEVKSGKKKPEYICKEAKEILEVTYGHSVYQEQIMQLCNKVAGFTPGEADMVRKFMSKKKVDKLAKFEPAFVKGLVEKGVDEQKAKDFWLELMDFGSYAFNKSHAAVYATVAYYTAWLKYHYPTEYMTAVMNYTPIKKLPMMISECRELGIKLIAPDVNRSEIGFTGKNNEIVFGLGSIKDVGDGAIKLLEERKANGSFHSLKDFLRRVTLNKKVAEALINAGAFDCWCRNRAAVKLTLPNLQDDLKKIADKTADVAELENALANTSMTAKERNKKEKNLENTRRKIAEYQERFDLTILPVSMPEDRAEKLRLENELLGMYISGHPLEEYPDAMRYRTNTIESANTNDRYVTFGGIITNLRVKNRKKDGRKMAFFDLEDETGVVEGCCFTRAYESIGDLLTEDGVILAEGKLVIETDDNDEIRKKILIENARIVHQKPKKVLVTVKGLHTWTDIVYPQLVPYLTESGSPVAVYDTLLGEFRQTTLFISRDVLMEDIEMAELSEADI